jgi:ankyrin repeat protein
MMQYLLDHGADVNVQNKDGITPLLHSVRLNNLESMDFLLRRGANPDIRSHVSCCMLR